MRAFFARLGGGGPGTAGPKSTGKATDEPATREKDHQHPQHPRSAAVPRTAPAVPPSILPAVLPISSGASPPPGPSPTLSSTSDGTATLSAASEETTTTTAARQASAAPTSLTVRQSVAVPPTSRAKATSASTIGRGRPVSGTHVPPPSTTEPLKSSTATRRPQPSSGRPEKMVAFTTPTTPEPVLALTGEPVNPRPPAAAASGAGKALNPLRTGRSSTAPQATTSAVATSGPSSKASLDGSTARSRASLSRTSDGGLAPVKAPLGSALRVKKGSSTTLPPGASSTSLRAVASRSSTASNAAGPLTTARIASASTSASQSVRLRRPELSRPMSAMSDSSGLTGVTSIGASGGAADGSFLGSHGNWSQWADEDLLMNLGPRERTRQEVLWEIVSSEERYVVDLQNLVNTFINSLLPPKPVGSPTLDQWTPPLGNSTATSTSWPSPVSDSVASPRSISAESAELLPIAARFQSTSTFMDRQMSGSSAGSGSSSQAGLPTPAFGTNAFDSFALASSKPFLYDTLHRPHPLGQLQPIEVPFPPGATVGTRSAPPSRSHQSMPPSTRASVSPGSSYQPDVQQRLASADLARRHHQKPLPAFPSTVVAAAARPADSHAEVLGLPDELREILEVLRDGILPGHLALGKALRARHEEQFPLVRSLADIFTQHSFVLREYNTYVLHLSDALGIVDSALTSSVGVTGKKARKADEGSEVARLRKIFQELDELAADKGESGLAISLSKPFQRLLKYPLLLQNLLFHTDPSTKEYEATLGMVDEVELIIRSIEDEKTAVEERVKTRDVFARIEGLEREKMLMVPRPSRLLEEEYPTGPDGARLPAQAAARRQVLVKPKDKKVSRRLSDMLKPTSTAMSDLWIVRFTDVSLLCQRTGTTTLPLAATATRSSSMPDLHGKAKFATIGGRRAQQQPRNLYRLVRVQEWSMAEVVPTNGMISMEDISISRTRTHDRAPGHPTVPEERPLDENEEPDSDDSFDAKSRMSFSYWGGDKVEPVPLPDGRNTAASNRRGAASSLSKASKLAPTPAPPNIVRRSSAQEKFGARLRSPEPATEGRPASRSRPAAGATAKRAITPAARPAWNSSVATSAPPKARTMSASNLPPAQRTNAAAAVRKSSTPTPSEDIASLYRASRGA